MRVTSKTVIAAGAAALFLLAPARFSAEPWWDRLVSEQKEAIYHPVLMNADGLRGPGYASPKTPGCTHVLILGDSFTYCPGVYNDADTFTRIIERRLNESRPGSYEVLNGGVPGTLTHHWVELWNQVEPRFEPDVLVIVYFLRDGTRTSSIPGFFNKIREDITMRNMNSKLYRYFPPYRLVRDRKDRMIISRDYTKAFIDSYFGDENQTAEWTRAQKNIVALRDTARQRGAPTGFVIYPVLIDLNKNYPFKGICDTVAAFARDNRLPCVNLLDSFMGKNGPDLWVSAYNQHPNEKANRIAADAIYPLVSALLDEHEKKEQP